MTEYVLVDVIDWDNPNRVLMVLKDRPVWQKGRLNLCGGHIEEGETPEIAALRELKEEAGLEKVGQPVIVGKIVAEKAVVYLTRVINQGSLDINPREGETEVVSWKDWTKFEDHVMPNLRVIIPLIRSGARNFIVQDLCWKDDSVELKVTLNI